MTFGGTPKAPPPPPNTPTRADAISAGSEMRLNPAGMSSFISSGSERGLKRKANTQKSTLVGG